MSGLILTTAGAAAIEAAYQAGTVVKITLAAFGDGGGKPIIPNPDATALVNKFGDAPFTGGASKEGMISGQTVIEARKHPGKVLREVGLVSADGVLVAYGDYPYTALPADGAPVMKEIIINFVMALTHAESVVIEVDPNISVLTLSEADKRYLRQALNLADVVDRAEARKNIDVFSKDESDNRFVNQAGDNVGWLTVDDGLTVNGKGFLVKNGLGDIEGNNERQTSGLRIVGAGNLFADIFHRERIGQNHFMGIRVANGGSDGWFEFRNGGQFIANGIVSAGGDFGGILHTDGNVQGNIWGGYLSEYINSAATVTGCPLPWPAQGAPAGWLICNGAAFDRNAFPRLALAYPNGLLPDLRGVFIRGWDAGRGLDPNRGLGDLQAGQAPASAIGRGDWEAHAGRSTGITAMIGTDADGYPTVKQETEQQRETRPVNVSFNYIVRAA